MFNRLDRAANMLHLALALGAAWLYASSPWLGMYARVPDSPGVINLSHLTLGFAVLVAALLYTVACTQGGRWRLYFPWAAADVGPIARDLALLLKGQRPASEGGGLFATLEGVLLLALVATAATGALWFVNQGEAHSLTLRAMHVFVARGCLALAALHVVSVSLHLIELVRD